MAAVTPRVAVITPTRNRLTLLCETIDSVQHQTFQDWEHLIVDDGSDDGTAEEVKRRATADSRIRYFRRAEGEGGANQCRNLGIQQSRAALIVFLDSDDLLHPACLQGRVAMMDRNADLDFVVFRARVFVNTPDDAGRLYHDQLPGDDLLRFLGLECPWQTSGPIWRRAFLDSLKGFEESLLSMQDLELHVRALSARGRYVSVPAVDHYIRGQHDELSTSYRHFKDAEFIQRAETTPGRLFAIVGTSGLLTWSRRRALLGMSFGIAQSWARTRRLPRALASWHRASLDQSASLLVRAVGYLMLAVTRTSAGDEGAGYRIVNKWKGAVRFRQEPSLQALPRRHAPGAE